MLSQGTKYAFDRYSIRVYDSRHVDFQNSIHGCNCIHVLRHR